MWPLTRIPFSLSHLMYMNWTFSIVYCQLSNCVLFFLVSLECLDCLPVHLITLPIIVWFFCLMSDHSLSLACYHFGLSTQGLIWTHILDTKTCIQILQEDLNKKGRRLNCAFGVVRRFIRSKMNTTDIHHHKCQAYKNGLLKRCSVLFAPRCLAMGLQ